jgi:hypothetical protein
MIYRRYETHKTEGSMRKEEEESRKKKKARRKKKKRKGRMKGAKEKRRGGGKELGKRMKKKNEDRRMKKKNEDRRMKKAEPGGKRNQETARNKEVRGRRKKRKEERGKREERGKKFALKLYIDYWDNHTGPLSSNLPNCTILLAEILYAKNFVKISKEYVSYLSSFLFPRYFLSCSFPLSSLFLSFASL